jgi:hypothetical protein
MSTAIQIATNRLNSKESSGPRSAQGKAASRANSLKTGLYARSQVIVGEDPAELRALASQYSLRWEPATPEESFLVATLIDSDWLVRRYSLADAKIWDYQGADDSVRDTPNGMRLNLIRCRDYFPLLQRRIDSAQRSFHRACTTWSASKRNAAPPLNPPPCPSPIPRRKPNPIPHNPNPLNKELASFLHFPLPRIPLAPSPCRLPSRKPLRTHPPPLSEVDCAFRRMLL